MADSSLLKKLRLLPGQRALVLNAPAGYLDRLAPLPADAALETDANAADMGRYDFVQVFVLDSNELARLAPAAQQACHYDGILWITYPKPSAPAGSRLASDLSRDSLWELMKPSGLAPVMQIAIDETWSALRFRPSERVGAGKT